MSNPSPATVGSLLKQGRQRQRLSISECAKRTHISPRYLEALEEERWSDLPSESHRVGFLQLYSRFLGINTDEVMGLYRQEKPAPEPAPEASANEKTVAAAVAPQAPATKKEIQSTPFWSGSITQIIFLGGLLLVGCWIGYHLLVNKDGPDFENVLVGRERPKQSRLVPVKPVNNIQKIKIFAQADSWLRLMENRQLKFEGILPAGTTKEWSGAGPFQLKMGNAKALTLYWNDQAIDVATNARGGINEVQLPLPKSAAQ
jgi:cytoskeletal protein RodZ